LCSNCCKLWMFKSKTHNVCPDCNGFNVGDGCWGFGMFGTNTKNNKHLNISAYSLRFPMSVTGNRPWQNTNQLFEFMFGCCTAWNV
jgi:hypothetical protein